ncbi:hypothetical protein Q1695_014702 [Nippostrongylus brasiliensis]|nr:hypothetical protein Q1695_014702 [Nippostrongylus brasiliensis]
MNESECVGETLSQCLSETKSGGRRFNGKGQGVQPEGRTTCGANVSSTSGISLRKRARAAENSIDVKLVSLNKLNSHAEKYPMINNVMQKIQYKKRKDAIVVAGVITCCLIFVFFYLKS